MPKTRFQQIQDGFNVLNTWLEDEEEKLSMDFVDKHGDRLYKEARSYYYHLKGQKGDPLKISLLKKMFRQLHDMGYPTDE